MKAIAPRRQRLRGIEETVTQRTGKSIAAAAVQALVGMIAQPFRSLAQQIRQLLPAAGDHGQAKTVAAVEGMRLQPARSQGFDPFRPFAQPTLQGIDLGQQSGRGVTLQRKDRLAA